MSGESGSITRRDFIIRAAAASGAGLFACSHTSGPDPVTTELDHIIVVTMENRSFDHLLGWVSGADGRQNGLSYPDRNGVAQPTFHLTDPQGCSYGDPNHSFEGGRAEFNNGACNGWLIADGNDQSSIGYYVAADLPFLGRAAPAWTVLDRYFCAVMGPTYPNRLVMQAGQTDRLVNTDPLFAPSQLPSIFDRLTPAGLSGRNYGDAITTSRLWGTRYESIHRSLATFFTDAGNGTLPNVAYVDPNFVTEPNDSYHPPGDIRDGEAFVAKIYKSVTQSPQWKSSLLIITFDEWGGYYDHVPPPPAPLPDSEKSIGNDGMRGFRVPTILVSPFVKRGAVSSRIYDHASILRLIESRWSLQPLTIRDAQANNLADELDLQNPRLDAPAIEVTGAPFGHVCT
jgi:phospholipase C